MATLGELRQEIFDYVRLSLADGMVEVELDTEHYEMALRQAFRRYRQRAAAAEEESFGFLTIVKNQQEYIMPEEVTLVRQVFRRTIGSTNSDSATQFEPFEAAFVNTYLLQSGRVGGLATYDFWAQYQELSARMFGGFLNFTYNKATRKLTFIRKLQGSGEEVLLWIYNRKPDVTILSDEHIFPWIQDYTLAKAKMSLGEARSKYATIAGPQGGTSLNGETLKAEALQELERLDLELKNFVDGSDPLWFVIG